MVASRSEPPGGEPTTAHPPSRPVRTAPRLRATRVEAVLADGGPSPMDVAVRAALSAPGGVPLRLVGDDGEHDAVDLVVDRARRLVREGGEPDLLDPAPLEAAREALRRVRGGGDGQGGAEPPPRALMERVEVLAWRLAFGVARVLGGPRVSADAPERLPGEVLADPAGWLARLEPAGPGYAVLVDALARYRRMASAVEAQGPTGIGTGRRWTRLDPGDTASRVARLRDRLREVGFPAPPVEAADRFGPALEAAIRDFQRRHALRVTGLPDEATLEALAVPLSERVAQIEAALDHLRRNPARRHPDRVEVNIPAFGLRLFEGDRVVARHRVVVGSNRWANAPFEEREGHLDRTPTLASRITDVVLNPSWHVPRRIKELELDPRAQRYSGVYDDFELFVDSQGVERAVQLPGPDNALGRVKFLFPGGRGVYLHDTPKKRLFDRVHRALSHGCVRVEDALDLARRLLALDRHPVGWSGAVSILRSGREATVTLHRPMPIFIHYVTAGRGADGDVRLYPDVYGRGPAITARPLPDPPEPLTRRGPGPR
ncbi:MAG: L,D-transpeptidase family protein [Myxococcota bacterium]